MEKQLKLQLSDVYCIDTDSLIELKRYPKDVFPSVWQKIESMIRRNDFISHTEVYKEITNGKDEMVDWCKSHKRIFKDIDECQSTEIKNVQAKYDNEAWEREINKTGPWADPWLIALAICEQARVITQESNKPNKIPFVADLLGIKSLNLIDFFRTIGIKL
jgi:hypothetical protein